MKETEVVIAGATGVVGAFVLQELLAQEGVRRVTALGRRAPALQHPKLASQIVDFQNAAALGAAVPLEVQVAVCALGTTLKQAGSKEAFRAVDYHAIVAFARAVHVRSAQRCVLVSSVGANPRSGNFYLRTKGEAEMALRQIGFTQLTILRPSFIDDEGTRREYRWAEHLLLPAARAFFSVFGKRSRYTPVKASAIARAVVRCAFDETAERVRVIESDRLHEADKP